ncbi:MAG: endonuclease/exonuclease/phosphatase family protein [Luteolibacter sp.]
MKLGHFAGFTLLSVLALLAIFGALRLKHVETPPWRADTTEPPSDQTSPEESPPTEDPDFPAFTFLNYNVKNWLISKQTSEKSPEAKAAVIRLLADASPDIIGICEIGDMDDVMEIQFMLEAEGVKLPHIHLTGGEDSIRHLAILSRFPFVSIAKPDTSIKDNDRSMQRGMLDVTVDTGGREVRFIGLHLKSKRTVQEFDQAALRLAEAAHARKHADAILAADPETLLVIYGDFNDTTRSLSTRTIYGTYRTPGYMNPIHVSDSRGESWTHCYAVEDTYSRIDFVTVSKALKRHVDKKASYIIDDPLWETASDHRPVLIQFR